MEIRVLRRVSIVEAALFVPALALALLAGCTPGFNGTSSGERSWSLADSYSVDNAGPGGTLSAGLCVFSSGDAVAPVIVQEGDGGFVLKIRRSTDDGESWREVYSRDLGSVGIGTGFFNGRSCVVDPEDDEALVLFAASNADGLLYAFRSTDRGATWTPLNDVAMPIVDTAFGQMGSYAFQFASGGTLIVTSANTTDSGVGFVALQKGDDTFGVPVFLNQTSDYYLKGVMRGSSGSVLAFAAPDGAPVGTIYEYSGGVPAALGDWMFTGSIDPAGDVAAITKSSGELLMTAMSSGEVVLVKGEMLGSDVMFDDGNRLSLSESGLESPGIPLLTSYGKYLFFAMTPDTGSGISSYGFMGKSSPLPLSLSLPDQAEYSPAVISIEEIPGSGTVLVSVLKFGVGFAGYGHAIYRYGR